MARPFRLSFAARLAVAAIVLSLLLPGSLVGAAPRASRLSEASVVPVSAPLPAADVAHRLSAEVYGYLPYWEIDDGTDAYLRYNLLTDIALFSVTFTPTGAIATSVRGYSTVTGGLASTIVDHAHDAGVRVDLTVTSFGFEKNAAFFSDPAATSNAAVAIATLVASMNVDGVSLDVELLENEYFTAYGRFVGKLRNALRASNPDARLSVATNGGLSGAGMANEALRNGADRVFIMGYAYRTAGTSAAGSVAPIVRADGGKGLAWTLDLYAANGVPADRALLGLPYYGRSWYTTSDALHAPTISSAGVFIPGSELAHIPAGVPIQHDAAEMSKWFAVQDPTTQAWTQTYFDDPETLSEKYGLASARGLAGVGIWSLGYDRGLTGYWNAIAAFGSTRVADADR